MSEREREKEEEMRNQIVYLQHNVKDAIIEEEVPQKFREGRTGLVPEHIGYTYGEDHTWLFLSENSNTARNMS